MGDTAIGPASTSSILVGNLYVMMAYAFRSANHIEVAEAGAFAFENAHNLFAHIVAEETSRQVKIGLHNNYLSRSSELDTVRGRIDVAATVTACSVSPGRVVCNYEELLPDTPHNRAVKATIISLARHDDLQLEHKASLKRALPYFNRVGDESLRRIRWNDLHIHRANASYRVLLGVCELYASGLIFGDADGEFQAQWDPGDALDALFERFVREYFKVHYPSLSAGAKLIDWDLDKSASANTGSHLLPTMRTDVTLRNGDDILVIDTKYYSANLQLGQFGKQSVRSAHLYQLSAYVANAAASTSGRVSGLLLYARTDAPAQPELDVVIGGHRLGATTIDLSSPWPIVKKSLDDLRSRF